MQSVGGSINDRAAAGQELIICALWAINAPQEQKTQMYFRQSAKEFVVTWKTERYQWFGEGYRPLGRNVFQARLTPDGSIELSYQKVSEKDGIVGVFPGGFYSKPIATLNGGFVEASLADGTVRFSFGREKAQHYRVILSDGANTCEIGVDLGVLKPWFGGQCTGNPGYRIGDHRIELFATTFELQNVLKPGVRWASWPAGPGDDPEQDGHVDTVPFPLTAVVLPAKLSALKGYREGNIFEVFHYPHVSKNPFPILHYIYQHAPPQDDFVAILADFRIDDLHNHQGTHAPYGYPVKGIGEGLTRPEDTFAISGSRKLQAVTGPAYLGPRYEEFVEDGDRHFKNYANAVGWIAHEFGHRWGLALQFRNPSTGKVENLADPDGHWSEYLQHGRDDLGVADLLRQAVCREVADGRLRLLRRARGCVLPANARLEHRQRLLRAGSLRDGSYPTGRGSGHLFDRAPAGQNRPGGVGRKSAGADSGRHRRLRPARPRCA